MNSYPIMGAAFAAMTGVVVGGVDLAAMYVAGEVIEGSGHVEEMAVPGETILVHWLIAKRTDCPGQNSRVWVGADNFYMVEPSKPNALPMSGDFRPHKMPTRIPDKAPPGPLTLTIKGYYDCNGDVEYFELGPVVMTVPG